MKIYTQFVTLHYISKENKKTQSIFSEFTYVEFTYATHLTKLDCEQYLIYNNKHNETLSNIKKTKKIKKPQGIRINYCIMQPPCQLIMNSIL